MHGFVLNKNQRLPNDREAQEEDLRCYIKEASIFVEGSGEKIYGAPMLRMKEI